MELTKTQCWRTHAQSCAYPTFLAEGPKTVEEIASHTGTSDSSRVMRLMYALAANGLAQLTAANTFSNSPLSSVLRSDHPNSMRGMVHHQFEDMYSTWAYVPELFGPNPVSTAWDAANPDYPIANGGIWSKFARNPASEEQFGRAMQALEGLGGQAMVEDGPWGKFDRFVDIGGSHGHFLLKLLRAHPDATGVLFDRPQVIGNAKAKWTGDVERISFVGGSFFDGATIPKARDGDVYFMRYILHDWQDAKVVEILKNVREAIGEKRATLLIGECALPDRDTVGVPPVMYNIDMQMMAAFGTGKERTPAEWRHLLASQGFEVAAIHPTRSLVHWVEAIPTKN